MATTANIDKTARTARQMAEAQRDSFEAIAENFAVTELSEVRELLCPGSHRIIVSLYTDVCPTVSLT